jgi:DNA replication protein DnaC
LRAACSSKGQPGVGKTHLAVAVLKDVVQKSGARGLFYDTRDLLRVIRSTYDPSIRTTELEILRPVMTADLLVLDDIGAEKTSEWVEETMNLIVNTRYNERRVTLFTSNYQDIPDDTDPNTLLSRIGSRMRSRLPRDVRVRVDGRRGLPRMPTNGGVDDLLSLWKTRRKTLPTPARSGRQARAQLREPPARDGRGDLKWPGGRGGS